MSGEIVVGLSGTACSLGVNHFKITVDGSSLKVEGCGQSVESTDSSYSNTGEISLQNHYGTSSSFDNITVRKYANPTPTFNGFHTEETYTPSPPLGGSGEIYYYHPDHLGSTVVVSDSDGNLEERISYQPFGLPRQSSEELYQFTSQEWEGDLGFYDYGARQYNPTLRRFMQADSIIPNPYNPQNMNRYSYVLNNPLIYIDPTGHVGFIVGLTGQSGTYPVGVGDSITETQGFAVAISSDLKISWGSVKSAGVGDITPTGSAGLLLLRSDGVEHVSGFSGSSTDVMGDTSLMPGTSVGLIGVTNEDGECSGTGMTVSLDINAPAGIFGASAGVVNSETIVTEHTNNGDITHGDTQAYNNIYSEVANDYLSEADVAGTLERLTETANTIIQKITGE
ncbi:MAG: hypothetical protein GF416_08965 [Candidatus Altiarchaeales archaeon]|nr:hypothetical protein [Candidatus Altiarchaeales archaeon]MBD3417248.1 hypothetical protein [Candidatus Altiarchaeales archaeon]